MKFKDHEELTAWLISNGVEASFASDAAGPLFAAGFTSSGTLDNTPATDLRPILAVPLSNVISNHLKADAGLAFVVRYLGGVLKWLWQSMFLYHLSKFGCALQCLKVCMCQQAYTHGFLVSVDHNRRAPLLFIFLFMIPYCLFTCVSWVIGKVYPSTRLYTNKALDKGLWLADLILSDPQACMVYWDIWKSGDMGGDEDGEKSQMRAFLANFRPRITLSAIEFDRTLGKRAHSLWGLSSSPPKNLVRLNYDFVDRGRITRSHDEMCRIAMMICLTVLHEIGHLLMRKRRANNDTANQDTTPDEKQFIHNGTKDCGFTIELGLCGSYCDAEVFYRYDGTFETTHVGLSRVYGAEQTATVVSDAWIVALMSNRPKSLVNCFKNPLMTGTTFKTKPMRQQKPFIVGSRMSVRDKLSPEEWKQLFGDH